MGKKDGAKERQRKTSQASDSDESDTEIPDYGNGFEASFNDNDSLSNDGGWSSDDDRELVEKVKATAKPNDKVNFKTRLKQLNWKEIAFKNYSSQECETRFNDHVKRVRRYRNLDEIATDIEANIKKCPLKKPLNSYQLFIQDQLANAHSSGDFAETMKNLATRYKKLEPEQRAIYERKADVLRQEYKLKKNDFNTGNISKVIIESAKPSKAKTPFNLYFEAHKSDGVEFAELRENYAKLSIDEKYKWITKAVSLAPSEQAKLLNKEEHRIFNGQTKTTPTAYSLFVKESYSKLREQFDAKNVFTEIAQRWKLLDAKKKEKYTIDAAKMREKAAEEQEAFNLRHGMTPLKKRRKSVYVERVEEESDHEEAGSSKPKKRKASQSSAVESSDDIDAPVQLKSPTKIISPKPSPVKRAQSPVRDVAQSPVRGVVQSPVRNVEVKKKRVKPNSESSEFNEISESDAACSVTSTGSKKKSKKEKKEKKEKKSKELEPPGDKPPSTLFKYFAKDIHTGKPHKAQKAFDKLSKKERKHLNSEYNEKVEVYVQQLKVYLSSLSKEDAVAYITKVKAAEDNEQEGEDEELSSEEY